jgi:hypothetical protein
MMMIAEEPGQTLLFENDRIRIWEELLPIGEQTTRLHRHAHQFMPIVVGGGTIEVRDETGAVVFTGELGAGPLGWRAADDVPFVHGARNLGDVPIRVIVVEDTGAAAT